MDDAGLVTPVSERPSAFKSISRELRNVLLSVVMGAIATPLIFLLQSRFISRFILSVSRYSRAEIAAWERQQLTNLEQATIGGAIAGGVIYVILRIHKMWRSHRSLSARCPYCGEFLRSPAAKQCRYCKRDWHPASHHKE